MCPAAIVLIAFVAVVAGGAVLVAAVAPLLARTPVLTVLAIMPFVPVFAVGRIGFGGLRHLLVAIVLVAIVVALPALVLEPRPALAQHAEIMIRELQIIFSLDAVSGELGIACHALVFFEQLGGIAARAIVLPVARRPAEIRASLPSAAAAAATLKIIDQISTSYRSKSLPLLPLAGSTAPFARLVTL
jgi:hypothetical protein